MSKPETSIISVPLANAYLNLNQEKDSVRNYEGFNKLNAPYYGGNLTPLWRKLLGTAGSASYTDSDENIYRLEKGVYTKTTKDGTTTTLKDDFQTYNASETVYDDVAYKWYYDAENYAYLKDGKYIVVLEGKTVKSLSSLIGVLYDNGRAVIIEAKKATFYFDGVNKKSVSFTDMTSEYFRYPTYTLYKGIMVVCVNNSFYGFDTSGTVTAYTTEYDTGSLNIHYRLHAACTKEDSNFYSYLGLSTGTMPDTLSEIADDEDLNGTSGLDYSTTPLAWTFAQSKTKTDYFFPLQGSNNLEESYSEPIGAFLNPNNSKLGLYSNLLAIRARTETCYLSLLLHGYFGNYHESITEYFKINSAVISSISNGVITITLETEYLTETLTTCESNTSSETSYDIGFVFIMMAYEEEMNGYYFKKTSNAAYETESLDEAIKLFNKYKQFTSETLSTYTTKSEITTNSTGFYKYNFTSFDYSYVTKIQKTASESEIETTHEVSYTDAFTKCIASYISSTTLDFNPNSTHGCAYNVSSHFRILVNSGEIQAISFMNNSNNLGTLVSNFASTEIQSYYVTSKGLNYVDENNKVHVLTVTQFVNNCRMQVLIDRYFVFNAIGLNCYDAKTDTWCRIGIDWNNRFLISDYSESTDTKYYMTSAMYRTTDNTPTLSMLFNIDRLNAIPLDALTPQYAQDATQGDAIQVYGTTDVNEDAVYLKSFIYSNNSWATITENNYVGTTAEVFSDDNLLIPVSIFTQFVTSYLNNIYAIIYNGFSPLYKSSNASSIIKFNFNIGSLITDLGLDALFILQGQYYRVSDKIIYAYTYTDGTLTDTQEVCNIGSLSFIGCSPSEAYFWSYGNRTLYRFTGARTLEAVLCADSINSIYATLYDTTTSSLYMSTDRGLVIYNSFGNYILEDIKMATHLTSTKLGITYQTENGDIYSLCYNKTDGYEVIPIELETGYFGSSDVQNVISDTLYVRLFNKNNLAGGTVTFTGYIQENYGETKELVKKTVHLTTYQFDSITNNVLLRYQPDLQRGIGISWKITSDFPISYIGIGASQTTELNLPKGNSPVMKATKYNF